MERQKVYCEIEFYKRFVDSFPNEIIPTEKAIKRNKSWNSLHSFIVKSDLIFNVSSSEFKNLASSDNYLLMHWKKSTGGECGIEFSDTAFPKLDSFEQGFSENIGYYNSVFLSGNSYNYCKQIEDSFGVKVISIDNIFKQDLLFKIQIETIKKYDKTHSNWNFLNSFKHPCNSMAIVDNYILINETEIKNNLIKILDKLLPDKLKIPFHISIFSKNENNNKKHFEYISKSIKKLRPNLSFKLTIHQLRNQFHDRTIITNYLILDSGSGFNLFKKNGAMHLTKIIGYFPSFTNNINEDTRNSYEVLRNKMKDVYNNSCQTEYLTNYWGAKENRLFGN